MQLSVENEERVSVAERGCFIHADDSGMMCSQLLH